MQRSIRKVVKGIIALGAVALLVMAFSPKPVEVETASVSRGHFEQAIEEEGKTRVRERYTISAPLAGRLLRIELDPGDPVEPGHLLAVMVPAAPALLDVRTEKELKERVGAAEASRQRAQAEVQRAKAALDQAQSDFGRTRRLADDELVPAAQLEREASALQLRRKEFEAAQFEEEVIAHQEALARAALVRARRGMEGAGERFEIRSPVSGRVLRLLQESEAVVPLGAPLLEIGDPSNMEVVSDLLTTDAVEIQTGMPVRIVRYGGETPLEGRVRRVEPSAFTKVSALGVEEQRVNVLIDLVSPYEEWKKLGDGFRVEVQIIVFMKDDALIIPSGALFRERDQGAIFVISDGRAKKQAIQVGRRNNDQAMIEEGLSAGQQVIVYPGDAVKEGVKIKAR